VLPPAAAGKGRRRGHLALRQGAGRPLHPCFLAGYFDFATVLEQEQGFVLFLLLPLYSQGAALLPRRMCAGVAAQPPPQHTLVAIALATLQNPEGHFVS